MVVNSGNPMGLPQLPVPFEPSTWEWGSDSDETFSTLSDDSYYRNNIVNPFTSLLVNPLHIQSTSSVMDIVASIEELSFQNSGVQSSMSSDSCVSDSESEVCSDISDISSFVTHRGKNRSKKELPVLSLDRLDFSLPPVSGNIIAKPSGNFNEINYLKESWLADTVGSSVDHLFLPVFSSNRDVNPIVSIVGPESIHENVDSFISYVELPGFELAPQVQEDINNLVELSTAAEGGYFRADQAEIVRRAFSVATRYDPSLIEGETISEELQIERMGEFTEFLISIDYKFRKGNAEIKAADAALEAGFNWETFDFSVDNDLIVKNHGDIAAAISEKHKLFSEDRISLEKITLHLSDYPGFIKLARLVEGGAMVYPDLDYRKNPYENLRPQERTLENVIANHAINAWKKGRIMLVRESDLSARQIRHINWSASFWIPKVGDVFGRWCIDASNRSDDRIPLNGGMAKEYCIAKNGKIILPQMAEIVQMWIQYKIDHEMKWSDMWIFKEDIKSCFNQLNFNPKAALHMGQRLAEDILAIHCCGNFGYTGFPGSWQIVGNALMWKVNLTKKTPVVLFVDDFGSAGSFDDTLHDSKLVQKTLVDIIGVQAVAKDKSEHAQSAIFLGWLINFLDSRGATIAPKPEAMEKLSYYLFSFDETKKQSLKLWQILASLIERYSNGIMGSRPFVQCFHKMVSLTLPTTQDIKSKYNYKRVKMEYATPSTLMAIEFWRSVCILWWLQPTRFAVPLEHYVSFNGIAMTPHEFVGISDSCSKRSAIGIYKVNNGSLDNLTLIAWMSVPFHYTYPLNKPTSAYQNTVEYIGVLLQLIAFNIIFPMKSREDKPPVIIKMKSDNKSAISWVESEKARSNQSQVACMTGSYLNVHSRLETESIEHLPGILMLDIDRESRRDDPAYGLSPGIFCKTLPGKLEININDYPIISKFIEMVDPTQLTFTKGFFRERFQSIAREFGPFITRDPTLKPDFI